MTDRREFIVRCGAWIAGLAASVRALWASPKQQESSDPRQECRKIASEIRDRSRLRFIAQTDFGIPQFGGFPIGTLSVVVPMDEFLQLAERLEALSEDRTFVARDPETKPDWSKYKERRDHLLKLSRGTDIDVEVSEGQPYRKIKL